ncbi:hypothetical protein CK203_117501 [Vitis vinifera]|uniref:Uncharacterized protein n=1 Tax=Vitis vinifera TaxID=29760 RepID=A0A438EMV0_VITVI|nr:hypothetical protein CK203_117501 [Vitis vinifera]
MDFNSFRLNVSPNWVPPFQVNKLDMGSCHLGPSFPVWLQSQKNLQYLNFSNASISSHIPNWFWNISFNLWYLSLSHNQLQVTLVELKAMAQEHNMDMNSLDHNGTISQYDERLIVITKGQSLEYTRTLSLVVSIDLSDNNLSGEFPEE